MLKNENSRLDKLLLSHYIFDEEISTTHCAKISRMKNDPEKTPYTLYIFSDRMLPRNTKSRI